MCRGRLPAAAPHHGMPDGGRSTSPVVPTLLGIDPQLCVACGQCVPSCAWKAITMDEVAEIDNEKCVGCALCVSICPYHAIALDYWDPVPSTHKPINWR